MNEPAHDDHPLDPSGQPTSPATAPGTVPLPPIVGMSTAATLHQTMLDALAHSADVLSIDASAVQRIDTAGVQLLLALTERAQGADKDIQWQGDTSLLWQAAAALGLQSLLLALPEPAAQGQSQANRGTDNLNG